MSGAIGHNDKEVIMQKMDAISRVGAEEFSARGFYTSNQPAIITNALTDWNAEQFWTAQNLAVVLKHRQIPVSVSTSTRFDYKPTQDSAKNELYSIEVMDFASIVSQITRPETGKHIYAMQLSIPDRLPELQDHFVVPHWIQAKKTAINLWFGHNTLTPLHFDLSSNFFAQVQGTKRFVIFAPQDSPYLYPYAVDMSMPHVSYVNPECPDLAEYPLFSRATPIEFTIQAGELLFLPAFWWHQVQSKQPSISVSFWWAPDFQYCTDCPNGLRMLYNLYRFDRLEEVRATLLKPSRLDFLEAAQLLLESAQMWAAAIFALAALHEVPVADDETSNAMSRPCLSDKLRSALQKIRENVPSLEHRIARGEDCQVGEIENIIGVLRDVTALSRTDSSGDR